MESNTQLVERLRHVFREDGNWNAEAIRGMTPELWQAWIAARLRGQDPWVPYAQDEYPESANALFVRFAREARSVRCDNESCKKGAARFLAALEASEPSAAVLRNAMDLVALLQARTADSLAALRKWVASEALLGRTDWPVELHRTALFALAALQARGDNADRRLWKKWLNAWDDQPPDRRYVFAPAAFAGLALCSRHVPKQELHTLLEHYRELRAANVRLPISAAILALWVGREPNADIVTAELWRAVQSRPQPRENWDIICRCADRMWPQVRPYSEMSLTMTAPLPMAGSYVSGCLWAADTKFSAVAA